jgi:hypothetical protein
VPISGYRSAGFLRFRHATAAAACRPGESEQRLGLNGGAGLRIGGSRVALMAEVRVFYFNATSCGSS